MRSYCKINTMFKRDTTKLGRNRIIPGDWATPEIEYLAENIWTFTEKVDGTNIRVSWNATSRRLDYGGRTDDAQISTRILRHLDGKFRSEDGMDSLAETLPGEVILYGEGYGDKVNRQGARSYLPGTDFVLFDVEILSEEGWLWLTRDNVEDIAAKLEIPVVPLIGEGTLIDAAKMTENGFPSQWGNFTAEGIVAKPKTELRSRRGERMIAKIKYHDYTELRRLEARDRGEA